MSGTNADAAGFVACCAPANQVKRDMDIARDRGARDDGQVRQGARGTDRGLADTQQPAKGRASRALHTAGRQSGAGRPKRIVWAGRKATMSRRLRAAARARRDADRRERVPPPALCGDDARRGPLVIAGSRGQRQGACEVLLVSTLVERRVVNRTRSRRTMAKAPVLRWP
jgi:hypothetical protein